MDNDLLSQIIRFLADIFLNTKAAPAQTPNPQPQSKSQIDPSQYKLTKAEALKGRDVEYASDYTKEISDNLDRLLIPMNIIRVAYGKAMTVDSGWRPPSINASTVGAATHSKHMEGLAVDIADSNGDLMRWVLANLQLMKDLNIYFEDFRWTPTWVHFQLGGPHSGKRIYVPSTSPAETPDKWDGKYDPVFDLT